MLKKLAIALATAGVLGVAVPASAQVVVERDYGWGAPYAYGGWWGGPRGTIVVRRHHFYPHHRYFDDRWDDD